MVKTVQTKVASANLNQTIVNFTRNVPLIRSAIDTAVKDGANILSLQELGLTGYSGDDNFQWIRSNTQQQEILELVKEIADYANSKDPNLVISLGFPLFYADKTQPVKVNYGTEEKPLRDFNPLYNINDRPFNAQAFISGGKIHGISLKSIQPDGAAEYEPRQFTRWPDYVPNQQMDLPYFGEVPVGNVILQLQGQSGEKVNLYHEICAEGWPGISDSGKINQQEMDEGRYLSHLAKDNDISLILNPSASKPEPYLDKPTLRALLASTGSKICKGAGYLYTNCLGLEAAPVAFEGGSIFVENGEVTHKSQRYSMADVEYSSSIMNLPVAEKGTPDAVISHDFGLKGEKQNRGGPAEFEAIDDDFARRSEETLRNTALWIRDYLKKTGLQGLVVSLSGGADSAFGAVAISQAIDLNIQQLQEQFGDKDKAVEVFIKQFPRLKYQQEVLDTLKSSGAEEAISVIKKNMLTCIYLPSDNSGVTTEDAAQCLIEGGTLCRVREQASGKETTVVLREDRGDTIDGHTLTKKQNNNKPDKTYELLSEPETVKGIGGKFEVVNVQASVDSLIEAYAGIVPKDLMNQTIEYPEHSGKQVSLYERVKHEIREYVGGKIAPDGSIIRTADGAPDYRMEFSPAVDAAINQKDSSRLLSWRNQEDDITLQNIQARARQPYPWMFGNKEHKIACVTSNWSEAVAGYWTFGGDGHMGAINLCGGVPKSHLKKMLRYLQESGLHGMDAVKALEPVNVQVPTAELRPTEQSDEADMMPYKALDAIAESIFFYKDTPEETYKKLQKAPDPEDESKLLFGKRENPHELDKEYLIGCIEKLCRMWHRSQFKRVAAVITPFLGQNVDPHTSVRTTILSDAFQTDLAQLRIGYLKDKLGEQFKEKTGFSVDELRLKVKIEPALRNEINGGLLNELQERLQNYDPRTAKSESIVVGGF